MDNGDKTDEEQPFEQETKRLEKIAKARDNLRRLSEKMQTFSAALEKSKSQLRGSDKKR